MKRTFISFLLLMQIVLCISAQDAESLSPNSIKVTNKENTMKRTIDNTPVQKFDLERYLGRWYEIARFDHRFERGLSEVTAEYTTQDNGMIKVLNSGFSAKLGKRRQAVGRAKLTNVPGVLRVSFFWIFYADYRVLALGDNYEWALVGSGRSGNYLWILSRTEVLPKETMETIISEAERRGYDTRQLIFSQNQR